MSTRGKRASTAAASAVAAVTDVAKKITGSKRGKKEENGNDNEVTSPSAKKGKATTSGSGSPATRTRSRSPSPAARKDKATEDQDPEVKHHENTVVYGKSNGKVALITGITGQDGSYLAELLLEKGYTVHGLIRRSSSFNTGRVEHLYIDRHSSNPRFFLHYGDLSDSTALVHIIGKIKPDELYNLAAQSHVAVSFELAEYTGNIDGLGTLRLLDAIRTCGLTTKVKFYQASTSELYGEVREPIQSETTPFYPRSPYAVAKQYAYWIVVNYREAYNMFACNGILFNHESPRRGPTFVTRKTTRAVARIAKGLQDCLYLGNLDAQRDWGHAKDYVNAMWMMLQTDKPDDFVVATGETHRVRKFVEHAFKHAGIQIKWSGSGLKETGTDVKTGKVVVRVDPQYYRPTEVELLLGNPAKIKKHLGWQLKVEFEDLVKEMVHADLAAVEDKHLKW